MRINTNVSALAAARNLGLVQNAVKASSEKLSSGFRINHASDDAAGLGVANTFRADIRAYTQAASNAEQATAVFNIAEGAAQSIASMLERMKELAVVSNSDTVDAAARGRADTEFAALQAEITRVIATTKFQGDELLDGGFGLTPSAYAVNTKGAGVAAGAAGADITSDAVAGTYTVSSTAAAVVTMIGAGGVSQTVAWAAGTQDIEFSAFGITLHTDGGNVDADDVSGKYDVTAVSGTGGTFSVGNSTTSDDVITVTAANLDLSTLTAALSAEDLTSLANANDALDAVDLALTQTNLVLGNIGSYQSRVNSASTNLKTLIQNFQAAESTIRDVDMASEMVTFSKNQILAQAGTAMLAQANVAGQGILKLFQ